MRATCLQTRRLASFSPPPPPPPQSPPPPPPPQSPPAQQSQSSAPKIVAVTESSFEREVLRSPSPALLLVGPESVAARLAPPLAAGLSRHPQLRGFFLDAARHPALARELGVAAGSAAVMALLGGRLLEAPLASPSAAAVTELCARAAEAGSAVEAGKAAEEMLAAGEAELEAGRLEAAAGCFDQAYRMGMQPGAMGGLALVAMRAGDVEGAEGVLARVGKEGEGAPLVRRARGAVGLAKALAGEAEAMRKREKERSEGGGGGGKEEESMAKYESAVRDCMAGKEERAVETLVGLAKSMPAAKELLFKIFAALGSAHPLTMAGRKKLALALF